MSDDHLSKILANFQQQVCTEFEIQRQFILSKNEELDKREKELQKNFNHLNMVQLKETVNLNVGGQFFTTSLQSLLSEPDSFFAIMFNGKWTPKFQKDGSIFIDRDPFAFRFVLKFLRGEKIRLETLTDMEYLQLLDDAEFYNLNKRKLFGDWDVWNWKPNKNFEISNNGKIATKIGSNWNLVVATTTLPKGASFSVRIQDLDSQSIMIGVAPKDIEVLNSENYNRKRGGWYLLGLQKRNFLHTNEAINVQMASNIFRSSTIKVELTVQGILKFYVDGNFVGEVSHKIDQEVVPAVEMKFAKDSIKFVV